MISCGKKFIVYTKPFPNYTYIPVHTCSFKIHVGIMLKAQLYSCKTLMRTINVNKRFSIRAIDTRGGYIRRLIVLMSVPLLIEKSIYHMLG